MRGAIWAAVVLAALVIGGCDRGGGGGGSEVSGTTGDATNTSCKSGTVLGDEDPLSTCTYGFTSINSGGKTIGERCDDNSECEFGVCLQPGEGGNREDECGNASNGPVNTQFGFCTRGCDCNNDTNSRLTEEQKLTLVCYNGPTGSEGKLKFVLPRCDSLDDCAAFDSGYTKCSLPPNGSGVFKGCLAP